MKKVLYFAFALFFIATSTLSAALNEKITMDFKDTDIRDIAKIICKTGNLGIVMAKTIRGNMTLSIRDTSIREALDMVSEAAGFVWKQTGNTIFFADHEDREIKLRVIELKHIQAEELAKILLSTIKDNIRVSSETRLNNIVFNGNNKAIDQALTIIAKLDQPARAISGILKVTRQDKIIHELKFTGISGETIELNESIKFDPVMIKEDKKHNFASFGGSIELGSFSAEGSCNGHLKADLIHIDRKSENEANQKIQVQFSVTKGKTTEVFTSRSQGTLKVFLTLTE